MDPVKKPLVGCGPSPFTYEACDMSSTLYYSAPVTGTCPAGTSGEPVTVEGGRFTSSVSQEDADAQAQNKLQDLLAIWCAPQTGPPVPIPPIYQSAEVTGACPTNDLGGPFVIQAGQYQSTVSQADADAQANTHLQSLLSRFCAPDPSKRTFSIFQTTDGETDYAYSGVTDLAVLTQVLDSVQTGQTSAKRIITINNLRAAIKIAILDGTFVLAQSGATSSSMTIKDVANVIHSQSTTTTGASTAIAPFSITVNAGDSVTIEFDLVATGTGASSITSRLQVTYP